MIPLGNGENTNNEIMAKEEFAKPQAASVGGEPPTPRL
jgi:hypothetical protein